MTLLSMFKCSGLVIFILGLCISMYAQKKSEDKLVVSFISIGTGIDYKASEQLNSYVQGFQKKHGIQLEVSTTNWGREGEIDYLYDLHKLPRKTCKLFVDGIKEMFADNERIKISINKRNE